MNGVANNSRARSVIIKLAAALFLAAVLFMIVAKTYQIFSEPSPGTGFFVGVSSPPGTMLSPTKLADRRVSTSDSGIGIAASGALQDTTYRPQSPRAYRQFLGAVDRNGDVDRRVPGWWLYAKSEAEASWLDTYGFPTPAEEGRLSKSTDVELAALVANGDLNAKAHQATRFAKSVFADGNVGQAGIALALLNRTLSEGGSPYQAFTVYGAYADLMQAYHYLPENQRTAEQRTILDKYDATAQLAFAYGTAFGDETLLALFNGSASRDIAGLGKTKELSGMQVANALASFARRRSEQGLPPIAIIPRPPAPQTMGQNAGAIILERY